MGKCNLDHSHADVVKKLHSQKDFLPGAIAEKVEEFLKQQPSQAGLNELFHLLKKYDLATEDEQKERDKKLVRLVE